MRSFSQTHVCFVVLGVFILIGCSRNDFQRQHERLLRENPAGVELIIKTIDGKTQFRTNEPIQFEELYTSKYAGTVQIEVLEHRNTASVSEIAHITDARSNWTLNPMWRYGIACCDSRHVWLDSQPIRIPYLSTQERASGKSPYRTLFDPLPNKPGTYEFYVTSFRVFDQTAESKTYDKGMAVTSSNVLRVEVVQ